MGDEREERIPSIVHPPKNGCVSDNPVVTGRLMKENECLVKDIACYMDSQKRLSSMLYGIVSKLDKLRSDPQYLLDFEFLERTLQDGLNSNKHRHLRKDICETLSLMKALKKEFQSRLEESEYSMMEQNKTTTVDHNGKTSTGQKSGAGQTVNNSSSGTSKSDITATSSTSESDITASTLSTKRLEPCPVSLHFRLDRSKFHFLSYTPLSPKLKWKCLVCQAITPKVNGNKSKAKVSLPKCNVCQVPLCVEPCFYLFHTTPDHVAAAKDHKKGLISLPLPSNDSHPSVTNYSHSTIAVNQEEQNIMIQRLKVNKQARVDTGDEIFSLNSNNLHHTYARTAAETNIEIKTVIQPVTVNKEARVDIGTMVDIEEEDNSFSSLDDHSSNRLDSSACQIGPNDVHGTDLSTTNEKKRKRKRKNDNSNENESNTAAHMIKEKYRNERRKKKYLLSLPSGQTECICEKCGKVISGKHARSRMLTHIRAHNRTIVECKLCGQKLHGQRFMKTHMERHKRDETGRKCKICGVVVKHRCNLKRHVRTHSAMRPFMCEICGQSFRQSTCLQQHVKYHYKGGVFRAKFFRRGRNTSGDTASKYIEIPQVKCLVCDESYCFSIDLIKHLKTHEETKADEGLGTKESLEDLVNRHIGHYEQQLPFTCDFCVNMYSTLPFLQEHMNVSHRSKNKVCTGEKDFQKLTKYLEGRHKRFFCTTCGLSTYRMNERGHMRVHTGENPFKCSKCPKTFAHSTPFRTHMWSHMGFRPFKCQHCTKEYSQKLDFVNHLKKIHGIEYKKGDKSHERATIVPKVARKRVDYDDTCG